MRDYCEYLQDVFVLLGPVRCRKMFGGYGVYHQDRMFALVADEVLYLKVDNLTRQDFVDADLPAFQFEKNGKPVTMSYYRAPDALFDDPELAAQWGNNAWLAAGRAKP